MENDINQNTNYQFLKFIDFQDLILWNVKQLLFEKIESHFPLVSLKECIKEENTEIKPYDFPDKEFKVLGVNNNTGIFDNYIKIGKEFKQSYKLVKENYIAYNPSRINVGSIGLKTQKHKHDLISPTYVVFSCKENLDPNFLFYLFKTKRFNRVIKENTRGSVRQNLTFSSLQSLKIPLPSLSEQKSILKKYNEKIKEAKRLAEESNQLHEKHEDLLFDFLGITKIPFKKNPYLLRFVNFMNISRWGYQYLSNHEQYEQLLNTRKYPQNLLFKLVDLNPRTSLSHLKSNEEVSFLPMECISASYGEVIKYRKGKVEKSKGYTKFKEGDLLWSKITPCMQNGKSCIVKDLVNGLGYGSTELHVIRKKENSKLNLRFLYHLLRTKYVLTNATFHFTGTAGQQRIPIEFLENLNIPLPPLEKQTEIVHKLDKLISDKKEKQLNSIKLKKMALMQFEEIIFSYNN